MFQNLPTPDKKINKMLDFLERRDDALVEEFFRVLEISGQKHVVDYILDFHNTANESAVCVPHLNQARTAICGQQLNSCVDEMGRELMAEEQSFVGSACYCSGSFAACEAGLLASSVDMDGLTAHDSSSCASETACKVVDCSRLHGQVASFAGVEDVDSGYQNVEFVAPVRLMSSGDGLAGRDIELRDYQKELSRPGIEGKDSHVDKLHTRNRFSGTTRVVRYQKGKTSLDFAEARDSEWQWHQLSHMQVCTSLQTDNYASTQPLSFLQARCPSCRPTNSVKALKASRA